MLAAATYRKAIENYYAVLDELAQKQVSHELGLRPAIPPEVYHCLGNRSALEWLIDQYRVTTDKRNHITSDPNREDDPEYIVRLLGRVVTVSLETVKLVEELPALNIDQ